MRSQQLSHLKSLKDFPPNVLFITGPSSSGKSTTVREWSESLVTKSFSNLKSKYSQQLLFEDILNQISNTKSNHENGFKVYSRCESKQEFILELQSLNLDNYFIILDSVEKLDSSLFNFFTKLPEIIKGTVVMISKVSWTDLISLGNSLVNPLILEFPAYTRDEILDILSLDCPMDEQVDFYRTFVKIVYETVYRPTKNLDEIRTLSLVLFPKFIEPIQQGKAKKEEISKLVSNVSSYLKEIGSSLILGTFTSTNSLELPYYTKFLLISSFLASFNPPRLDVRFFSKEKEARGILKRKKSTKIRQQLLGPRIFPFGRMLAIFYSIIDEPLQDSIIINQQVTTLVNLKLLSRISSQDKLDGLKFKCNSPFEIVNAVASSVKMDLVKYLNEWI